MHAVARDVVHPLLDAALALAQLEDAADVVGRRQDRRRDDRLLDLPDAAGFRQFGGAVDFLHHAVGRGHAVQDAGRGRDQVLIELALEPLLDDFHVEQAQESAAKPETQRGRCFRFEEERGVVQAQLLERLTQLGVLRALHRIEPGEDHRLQFLETRERRGRRPGGFGDGVADLRVGHVLDVRHHEAGFADAERIDGHGLRPEHAELFDLEVLAGLHQADLHARPHLAVDDAREDDDAAIRVVPGIENQRLQRRVGHRLRAAAAGGRWPRGSPGCRGLPWRWQEWRRSRPGR